jgi:hypothetical protein
MTEITYPRVVGSWRFPINPELAAMMYQMAILSLSRLYELLPGEKLVIDRNNQLTWTIPGPSPERLKQIQQHLDWINPSINKLAESNELQWRQKKIDELTAENKKLKAAEAPVATMLEG